MSAADEPSVRTEHDSIGAIDVPADRLWGAQTQRSLELFRIGRDRFVWRPLLVHSYGHLKAAAAATNGAIGRLDPEIATLVESAADEVANGRWDDHFPLVVFQTGSGTQTNMNVNEVVANRAIQLAGGVVGSKDPVHPNDHVNHGQSSNDTFPTVMHVSALLAVRDDLRPALTRLSTTLRAQSAHHADLVKVGRTHLQDATPVMLGQEIASWAVQLERVVAALDAAADPLATVPIGGTAVGTGLNTHPDFAAGVAERLGERLGLDLRADPEPMAAIASHDAIVTLSAATRSAAAALWKIADDVRWLASGPRNGIGELRIPANEPGSSIMPGKVNPTQAEALTMVCARVYGNDATVAAAGSQGRFQLNTYKPVMIDAVLESIDLLASAVDSFHDHCIVGLEPDRARIAEHLANNLMLVTALAPHIGYDRAATIAKTALADQTSLRAAAIADGVDGDDYDRWVDPAAMTRPS